jgi:hypothetical protein
MKATAQKATATDINKIVGPLDDDLLLEILQVGATATEVLEAFTWANSDDQIGTELERGPRGAVNRVYEILKMAETEPDERR